MGKGLLPAEQNKPPVTIHASTNYDSRFTIYDSRFTPVLKKLDWYIIRKFVGTFFFVILILALIACVIDWSEKASNLVKNGATFIEILNYFKNFVPHISALLYPLFVFIAAIFFTSQLAYKSEIIAMLATGMSFNRFLRPYVAGATMLGILALAANHYIVPIANKGRLAFEDKYIHEKITSSDRNVHLQLSPTLLVFVESYDYVSNSGFKFTAERIKGTLLLQKTSAERISYDSIKKIWTLSSVHIRTNDTGVKESHQYIPELRQHYPFTPQDLKENNDVKEALTTPQLKAYIARQRQHGNDSLNIYYVELYRRTAQPVAGFILSLIGACIASRKIRGGSGFHLAIGIAISLVYMLCLQFSTTFSTKAGLNPLIAVWIPNVLAAIGAYAIYRRQSSGR